SSPFPYLHHRPIHSTTPFPPDLTPPLSLSLAPKLQIFRFSQQGDTKGSAKGGDASAKKEAHPTSVPQIAHGGSFSQGVNYATSQRRRNSSASTYGMFDSDFDR
ncbi:hypothetical protein SDJN02_19202, partial [Cucurbita argyrosperma subsp. argyrosperma]